MGLPKKSLSLPPASLRLTSRGSIRWLELQFPKPIESATGEIAEVERCRATTADSLASGHERFEVSQVKVSAVAMVVGEARRQ